MIDLFVATGYSMWAILLASGAMCGVAIRTVGRTRGRGESAAATLSGGDAILFWATVAFVIGLIGTLLGARSVGAALRRVAEPAPGLVWEGIQLAPSTTLVGSAAFLTGLLCWGAVRLADSLRGKQRDAASG